MANKNETIESRFLEMFDEVSEMNVMLTLKVKELEQEIEELKNNPITEDERNYIYLDNKPNYFYDVDTVSYYDWNKCLINAGKTPELVEQALTDDEKLKELCEVKNEGSYWRKSIGQVKEYKYDYLFKDRKGNKYVITLDNGEDATLYKIDNSNSHFLDEDLAIAALYEEIRKDCQRYLNQYKEKFEEEKEKLEKKNEE